MAVAAPADAADRFLASPIALLQGEATGRVYAVGADGRLHRRSVAHQGWIEPGSATAEVQSGEGWAFTHLAALGFGQLLARAPDGGLFYYRDLSRGAESSPQWSPRSGLQVGSGWNPAHLVALDDGHLLAIDPNGDVWWHQWTGDTWHPASGSVQVGSDWIGSSACGGGGGVVYLVDDAGNLTHRTVGLPAWLAPDQPVEPVLSDVVRVASGWDRFDAIFSPGNGVVVGVTPAGEWRAFQHGPDPEAGLIGGPVVVAPGGGGLGAFTAEPATSWSPIRDDGPPIDAYWIDQSVRAGATPRLALSSDQAEVDMQLRSVGGDVVARESLVAENHGLIGHAWRDGCGWPATDIPIGDVASGLYVAELTAAGATLHVPLVVSPRTPRAPLAVIANTNTWNAYNDWGGIGQYTNPWAEQLSFHRPARNLDPARVLRDGVHEPSHHLTPAEVEMLTWLRAEGVAFDLYSDRELHDGSIALESYSAMLIHAHPEYWTTDMYDRTADWLEQGGTLLNVGGNCVYETVSFVDQGTAMQLRAGLPEGERDLLRFGGRRERSLLGAAFEGTVYPDDPPGLAKGNAALVYAPYRVTDASHRFFAGTSLADGDEFVTDDGITGGAGWEVDNSFFDGNDLSAGPAPDDLQLLAVGMLGERPGEEGRWTPEWNAHMTYYDHPGGGFVFSAGSLVFTHWMLRDERAAQVIRNALVDAVS